MVGSTGVVSNSLPAMSSSGSGGSVVAGTVDADALVAANAANRVAVIAASVTPRDRRPLETVDMGTSLSC